MIVNYNDLIITPRTYIMKGKYCNHEKIQHSSGKYLGWTGSFFDWSDLLAEVVYECHSLKAVYYLCACNVKMLYKFEYCLRNDS